MSHGHEDNESPVDSAPPNARAEQKEEAASTTAPLYFYNRNEPYFEFTNFSDHPIVYENEYYSTAEHIFQAFKFLKYHPELARVIRAQPTPRRAREEATRLRRLQRSDWFDINVKIMDRILYFKFTQHPALARMLLDTEGRELVEDSPDDFFWGAGRDRTGRNELGKALMRLRDKIAADATRNSIG